MILQVVVVDAGQSDGTITKLPPEVPPRTTWLPVWPPLVRPTVSYSWSHGQYELCVTSA